MRVIAGKFRGRRFSPPKNMKVRPTTDRGRESLFGLVDSMTDIEGAEVLDLFAGTGAISIEFVSRGAAHVVAVDVSAVTKKFIDSVCADFGIESLRTVKADVFKVIRHAEMDFDIVFVDPPYNDPRFGALPDILLTNKFVKPDGLLIIEHPPVHNFAQHPKFVRHKNYGIVNFSFFRP